MVIMSNMYKWLIFHLDKMSQFKRQPTKENLPHNWGVHFKSNTNFFHSFSFFLVSLSPTCFWVWNYGHWQGTTKIQYGFTTNHSTLVLTHMLVSRWGNCLCSPIQFSKVKSYYGKIKPNRYLRFVCEHRVD